jgi:hypothetical protein
VAVRTGGDPAGPSPLSDPAPRMTRPDRAHHRADHVEPLPGWADHPVARWRAPLARGTTPPVTLRRRGLLLSCEARHLTRQDQECSLTDCGPDPVATRPRDAPPRPPPRNGGAFSRPGRRTRPIGL